ncbi:unnamed protein product [Rhizoctonia solani]|uniref:F-box domain-containing protein n=1 Tax=Rhizoctonia solani TaxID=456999 RepID=A0A8H3HFD1_9AGAM|nr:unnamed protein product [Rhizoctonia solani]
MDLPDIVHLIAGFLDQNDRARLAQVSKFYFQSIMPLAWSTVTGAALLFKLLPGVKIETPGALAGTETIHLPRNLDTTDFTRFKFYAKFVKHLLFFKNPAVVTKINRWEVLLRYTGCNILLPSLSSISLGTYWPQSIPHYAWIAAFSSPSVRRIEIHPLVRRNLPTISSETASALFNLLIDRCPSLESFSIFVDPKQRTSPLETGFLPDGAYRQGIRDLSFEAIKHVRSLSCTSSIAEYPQNTFLLLSRFPKLEVLQMYASQQDDITNATPFISLEPEAFSRLTKLTLCDFGRHATLSILNHLTSTAGLIELTLEINHSQDNNDADSSVDEFYNTMLIPAICARTSHLTHLSIRPMLDDKVYVQIDSSAVKLLASLRLKSLTLAKSHAHLEHLSKLFPQIQTFRWPDQPVTLNQLWQFVVYHQLEHLSVKLDLSPLHIIEPLRDRAMPPVSPCVLESDYGNLSQLSQAETQKLLRHLARLWARPVILQQITPFDYPHYDFAVQRRLEDLNKELEKARQEFET